MQMHEDDRHDFVRRLAFMPPEKRWAEYSKWWHDCAVLGRVDCDDAHVHRIEIGNGLGDTFALAHARRFRRDCDKAPTMWEMFRDAMLRRREFRVFSWDVESYYQWLCEHAMRVQMDRIQRLSPSSTMRVKGKSERHDRMRRAMEAKGWTVKFS